MEDRHMQEMKSLRERITTAEQEKREKWTQQKTKAIKVSHSACFIFVRRVSKKYERDLESGEHLKLGHTKI